MGSIKISDNLNTWMLTKDVTTTYGVGYVGPFALYGKVSPEDQNTQKLSQAIGKVDVNGKKVTLSRKNIEAVNTESFKHKRLQYWQMTQVVGKPVFDIFDIVGVPFVAVTFLVDLLFVNVYVAIKNFSFRQEVEKEAVAQLRADNPDKFKVWSTLDNNPRVIYSNGGENSVEIPELKTYSFSSGL